MVNGEDVRNRSLGYLDELAKLRIAVHQHFVMSHDVRDLRCEHKAAGVFSYQLSTVLADGVPQIPSSQKPFLRM